MQPDFCSREKTTLLLQETTEWETYTKIKILQHYLIFLSIYVYAICEMYS